MWKKYFVFQRELCWWDTLPQVTSREAALVGTKIYKFEEQKKKKKEAHQASVADSRFCLFPVFVFFLTLFLCTPVYRLSRHAYLRFQPVFFFTFSRFVRVSSVFCLFRSPLCVPVCVPRASLVSNVFRFCTSLVLRFASACFFHFCWLQILYFI